MEAHKVKTKLEALGTAELGPIWALKFLTLYQGIVDVVQCVMNIFVTFMYWWHCEAISWHQPE